MPIKSAPGAPHRQPLTDRIRKTMFSANRRKGVHTLRVCHLSLWSVWLRPARGCVVSKCQPATARPGRALRDTYLPCKARIVDLTELSGLLPCVPDSWPRIHGCPRRQGRARWLARFHDGIPFLGMGCRDEVVLSRSEIPPNVRHGHPNPSLSAARRCLCACEVSEVINKQLRQQ